MVLEKEIQEDWGIHKLLITGVKSKKYLAFRLGQFDIYLQDYTPIIRSSTEKDAPAYWNTPYIAIVRTPCRLNVSAFIKEMREFRVYKIFKWGPYLTDIRYFGFIDTCMMNAMGLRQGSTFYIDAPNNKGDSSNLKFKKLFYERAVKLNEEHNFGCKFDYDEYDYKFEVRTYRKPNGNLAIVTVMSGDDMPNDWRTSEFNPVVRFQIKPQGTRVPWGGNTVR